MSVEIRCCCRAAAAVAGDDLLDGQPAVGIDADIDSEPIAGAIVDPDDRQIRRHLNAIEPTSGIDRHRRVAVQTSATLTTG